MLVLRSPVFSFFYCDELINFESVTSRLDSNIFMVLMVQILFFYFEIIRNVI